MAFNALIHIIKVNPARSGAKDGRPWEMQDAECLLLDEAGQPTQVGVLMLPKELRNKTEPGYYTGSFALSAGLRDRRIEAILTGLVPVDVKQIRRQAAPAPAAS
ncbi:hypothetical protein GT347_01350 [Xylophilus rhododendri]|uniref:Cellulose synthase n=1 Tax=Xylophilus rhododendri TaxID=2697032 RepID=A0A857J1K5_9BURK|nr:hypothetical protein [Xylophilus rhododendri]QHI96755.1 hypothetical protein GT347_01350 [Xylophilus rhododendri]